jgi:hypothetical protein
LFHEDTFIATLSAARKEKYVGWELPQISQQEISEKEKIEPRSFPFELDGLLPWWKTDSPARVPFGLSNSQDFLRATSKTWGLYAAMMIA